MQIYEDGEAIKSISEFEELCKTTNYFRYRGMTVPKGEIFNLQYRRVKTEIERGEIRHAKPIGGAK